MQTNPFLVLDEEILIMMLQLFYFILGGRNPFGIICDPPVCPPGCSLEKKPGEPCPGCNCDVEQKSKFPYLNFKPFILITGCCCFLLLQNLTLFVLELTK